MHVHFLWYRRPERGEWFSAVATSHSLDEGCVVLYRNGEEESLSMEDLIELVGSKAIAWQGKRPQLRALGDGKSAPSVQSSKENKPTQGCSKQAGPVLQRGEGTRLAYAIVHSKCSLCCTSIVPRLSTHSSYDAVPTTPAVVPNMVSISGGAKLCGGRYPLRDLEPRVPSAKPKSYAEKRAENEA